MENPFFIGENKNFIKREVHLHTQDFLKFSKKKIAHTQQKYKNAMPKIDPTKTTSKIT